jgi:Ca-activated chloride channel homolog
MSTPLRTTVLVLVAAAVAAGSIPLEAQDGFRFRSGVELINVAVTVTDQRGTFVEGLQKEDFTVYDEGVRQEISHFSNEPVPVSLGILLDTSGSMTAGRMAAARAAINRFVFELLGDEDELFLMTFGLRVELLEDWTRDRDAISRAAGGAVTGGSTPMYDAVGAALPRAESGRNRKKALLVITDGNDTSSRTSLGALRRMIQQSEVMVYALGVENSTRRGGSGFRFPLRQFPLPIPLPGRGGRRPPTPIPVPGPGPTPAPVPLPVPGGGWSSGADDRVNANALREMTDDSGGRTEIVRGFENLDAATARLAEELNKQYYLGYVRTGDRDGRWHAIRVDVNDRRLVVRARQGYFAS